MMGRIFASQSYNNGAALIQVQINDQYRICFVWTDSGPDDVEIVDYH